MDQAQRKPVQPRNNGCGCGGRKATIVEKKEEPAKLEVLKKPRKIFA